MANEICCHIFFFSLKVSKCISIFYNFTIGRIFFIDLFQKITYSSWFDHICLKLYVCKYIFASLHKQTLSLTPCIEPLCFFAFEDHKSVRRTPRMKTHRCGKNVIKIIVGILTDLFAQLPLIYSIPNWKGCF